MGKVDFWESNKIRATFLEFFSAKGHKIVPSAPMVIKGDPTLMFTNAGMNQFKDIFLGNSSVISPRVADSQKCLRVSGKHNDLDEVGHDTYHHTMFEMLGNWSFGDYFKKEAIEWAWELMTEVYELPKNRFYATIFEGSTEDGVERDTEAYDVWSKLLPEEQIINGNKKDNFWEMGEMGPCGPCSELHFDMRSEQERKKIDGRELVNGDHPHVIEIWNLVFMQFNRRADGSLLPLPAQHVDTGMGFERLCMILQGKQSSYDTDVFQPSITKLAELSGKKYGDNEGDDVAMRVIADHLRAIVFSIADGQLPSNVKAGYVIRRILRRAVRYGYTYLGFTEPFMCELVEGLAKQMGAQYPEVEAQKKLIRNVIFEEENSFLNTLATGISLLDNTLWRCQENDLCVVSGKDAFALYDTYGFPIDLTELIAREEGMSVDFEEFERELEAQKNRSRSAATISADDWQELLPATETEFMGYDTTVVKGVHISRYRKVHSKGKDFYQLVLDRTPFYGSSGGQVGDSGYIESGDERITIRETQRENSLIIHVADKLPTDMRAQFYAVVDIERRNTIANNHTATHLLHEALREVLGTHVEQKGSLVEAKYLRFDFSHFSKVTDEQIVEVEKLVNRRVRENRAIEERRNCTIEEAKEMGAIMLFGEKYEDSVRVVGFGESRELCGGTHATATGNIGLFKILSESAISAGIRRVEAVTGEEAEKQVYMIESTIKDIQTFLNTPSVLQAVRKMFDENDGLNRQMEEYRKDKTNHLIEYVSNHIREEHKAVWIIRQIDAPADIIKDVAFALRLKIENLVLVVGSNSNDKTTLTIMLGSKIAAQGINAAEIIRIAAKEIDGGGGGQPFFATAGGKKPEGLEKAIFVARDLIKSKLK